MWIGATSSCCSVAWATGRRSTPHTGDSVLICRAHIRGQYAVLVAEAPQALVDARVLSARQAITVRCLPSAPTTVCKATRASKVTKRPPCFTASASR